MALMANVHGDITHHLDLLALFSQIPCHYLTFVMPDCTQLAMQRFTSVVDSRSMTQLRVDPADYNNRNRRDIKTSRLHDNSMLQKVADTIKKALTLCPVSSLPVSFSTGIPANSNIVEAAPIHTPQSAKLVEYSRKKLAKVQKSYWNFKFCDQQIMKSMIFWRTDPILVALWTCLSACSYFPKPSFSLLLFTLRRSYPDFRMSSLQMLELKSLA